MEEVWSRNTSYSLRGRAALVYWYVKHHEANSAVWLQIPVLTVCVSLCVVLQPWELDSSISPENREVIERMLLEEQYPSHCPTVFSFSQFSQLNYTVLCICLGTSFR